MSRFRIAAAAAALALTTGTALAAGSGDKWTTRVVPDRPGPAVLDPTKAYILVQGDGLIMPSFMRQPTAAEAADHARERAEALAREHARWEKKFAAWQTQMQAYAKQPASVSRPAKPQEPTEENFGFPEYQQVHSFMMGPENRFFKAGTSVYLQEVPPGEYILYGTTGVCACLGTVAFDAPAGKVVALRYTQPFLEAWRDAPREQRPKTPFDLPPGTSTLRIAASDFTDARLPAGSVVKPAFRPAGTRPNWSGGEVDRVMPIEGVFRYERDRQVDLRPAPPAQ